MRWRSTEKKRLLCFDLENRPLAYWYDGETTSEVTAIGWKYHDEPCAQTLLLRADGRFESDSGKKVSKTAAYEAFTAEIRYAGLVYGHNIRRHDLPMLTAQLLRLGLPPLGSILTTDTCRDYPRRAGMSASLENLAAYYGLEGEKKKMTQPAWEDANRLTASGIEAARERVVADVLLQEQLRDHLVSHGLLKPPRMWSP